jgi:hypothetical protein
MYKCVSFSEKTVRSRAIALAAITVVGVSQIFAWSSNGHQTVGAIADALIAKHRAAQQVASILGKAQGKQLTLSAVAVWADCIRSVHPGTNGKPFTYNPGKFKEPACAIFEDAPGKAAMIDYAERNNSNCQYDGKNVECHKAFHFADISPQHTDYQPTYLGANDHDVVHAINAAIAVLRGKPAPAPFNIASQKEALMLLVHFVGDLHQPLHVSAVYLNPQGAVIDPETGIFNPQSDTHGGNSIGPSSGNLHSKWDATKYSLTDAKMLASAKAVSVPSINVLTSPADWASDTVRVAKANSFPHLKMGAESEDRWPLTAESYTPARAQTQSDQVVKGGARLAVLLEALWPDTN